MEYFLQCQRAAEPPATDPLARDVAEPSLHRMDPRGPGWCETHVEVRAPRQRVVNCGRLLCAVSVQHQVDCHVLRDRLASDRQEFLELD